MTRKSLRILVPAALAVAAAPFLFLGDSGWRSPCACLARNELFAKATSTDLRTLFDPEQGPPSVVKGLGAKVSGRTVDDWTAHPAFARATCARSTSSLLVCRIWLEKKGERERGYEIGFVLAADEKIHGLKHATIIQREGS
jgi:hypothetical protein